MKRWLVTLALLPFLSFSQQKETRKAGFHSIAAGGFVTGEMRTKAFFQYSGGVSFDRFFGGIGIGYDAYRFNTVPVFADWRVYFGDRKVLFMYAHAGINIPGKYKKSDITFWKENMRSDLYTDVGTGYRFHISKAHLLSLSAGYSHKKIVQTREFVWPCGTVPCYQSGYLYTYHYGFGRIIVKAGWEFGR